MNRPLMMYHYFVMFVFAALVPAWLLAQQPQASGRTTVTDLRQLLVAAIDAADGKAQGILTGDMVKTESKFFKTYAPLYVDVSTERRYAQEGCGRLKMDIWQDGVLLPGAKVPKRESLTVGLNYCRDGRPPASLK